MRSSATKRRRSGTVSKIALSASRKPIITAIAENSEVDWRLGVVASLSSRSSSSAGRTSRRAAASALELPVDDRRVAGERPDQDLTHAARLLGERLRDPEHRHRHRTVGERGEPAAVRAPRARAHCGRRRRSSAAAALRRARRAPAPRRWAARGRPVSSCSPAYSSCVATPPSSSRLGVTPINCTASWPAGRAERDILAQHRRGDLDPREAAGASASRCSNPCGGARHEREARRAHQSVDESALRCSSGSRWRAARRTRARPRSRPRRPPAAPATGWARRRRR